MAKPNQKPSVHFTHPQLIALLNEVWTSQFIQRGRHDLRQAADSFFAEAVDLTGPGDDLSSLAPHVPALEEALKQHRVDIAEKKVTLGPPKGARSSWYATLKNERDAVLKMLRAPVRPTEAKPATTPVEQGEGALTTSITQLGNTAAAANETSVAASNSSPRASSEAPCQPTLQPDSPESTDSVGPTSAPAAQVPDDSNTRGGTAPFQPANPPSEPAPTSHPVAPLQGPAEAVAQADDLGGKAASATSDHSDLVVAQRTVAENSDWEMPARLAEAAGPAFPCEVLSPSMRKFVEQLAEQTQVPVDVPAVWTLAAFGAAAAKGVIVEVRRGERHPTNLWTAAVMLSGGGKTPTLLEIRRPFDEKQLELRAAARGARARRETELRVTRRRLRGLEKEAAEAEDQEEREALLLQCATMQGTIFDLERPAVPTLTTGDPTQASLTQLMDENDGKLLLLTDEGDLLFTRIGGGEGIEAMLQAHSGTPIERTRAGRHEIRVAAPALSLVIGIQPAPFARVMATRAYHDKGFLARMLFIVLDVKDGARKQLPTGLDDATQLDYRSRIRRLLDFSSTRPVTLTLASGALSAFSTFGARVDRDIALGALAELREWGNKLRGVAARLAGILHAADHALSETIPTEITAETMQRAIRIAEYFEAHAFVAYGDAIRSAQDESAKKVWRWISDARLRTFRHGDAVRSLNGRLTSDEVAEALDRLVDEGYLRVVSTPRATRGRPSKATYRVNPLLIKPTEETDKSQ